jgi:hypothetical protein
MNIEEFKKKSKNILGFFHFNKGPLNLNNNYIKSNHFANYQAKDSFYKGILMRKKIEMKFIDYPHSKSTHNLKVVKF